MRISLLAGQLRLDDEVEVGEANDADPGARTDP